MQIKPKGHLQVSPHALAYKRYIQGHVYVYMMLQI